MTYDLRPTTYDLRLTAYDLRLLAPSDLAKQLFLLHHASKRNRLGPSERWLSARKPKPSKLRVTAKNFDFSSSYGKTLKHVITFFIIFKLKMAKPNLTYGVLRDLGRCGDQVGITRSGLT